MNMLLTLALCLCCAFWNAGNACALNLTIDAPKIVHSVTVGASSDAAYDFVPLNSMNNESWVTQGQDGTIMAIFAQAGIKDEPTYTSYSDIFVSTISPGGQVATDFFLKNSYNYSQTWAYPNLLGITNEGGAFRVYCAFRYDISGYYGYGHRRNAVDNSYIDSIPGFENSNDYKDIFFSMVKVGPTGNVHIVYWTFESGSSAGSLYYLSNKSGGWIKSKIGFFPLSCFFCATYGGVDYYSSIKYLSMAVDKNDKVHIALSKDSSQEGSSLTSDLTYVTNTNGQWVKSVVVSPPAGAYGEYGWNPNIVIDSKNKPHIASTRFPRVQTGSGTSSSLQYSYKDDADAWHTSIVVTESDGYAGTDGTHFTGWAQDIVLDSQDRPVILFSDVAAYHKPNFYDRMGQIRYARLKEGHWELKTIFPQTVDATIHNVTALKDRSSDDLHILGYEKNKSGENVTVNLLYFKVRDGETPPIPPPPPGKMQITPILHLLLGS